MEPTKRTKLFIISGASCIGKSSACEILFQNEKDYIVMESDLLWSDIYNTPENDYRSYRELWMRFCSNISQIGMPVVLCGCAIPEQFEVCDARRYFSEIIYIAVVAEENELVKRMKFGRGITDENWVRSSVQFNEWLKNNAYKTTPKIPGTHMVLQALEYGIHSTWISYFDVEKVSCLLDLPQLYLSSEIIAFGYSAEEIKLRPKKKVEELAFCNKYW